MWKAFSISFDMRGGPAVALFAAAVVVGEVVTKLLVLGMPRRLAASATAAGTTSFVGG